MSIDITLIIYAAIAAGLVLWLRSILGTRTGSERERPPLDLKQNNAEEESPLSDKEVIEFDENAKYQDINAEINDVMSNVVPGVSISGENTARVISEIAKIDKNFGLKKFALAAQDAFAIVVEAFADGDRETLKDLLGEKVYDAFDASLKEREGKGQVISTEVHAVRKTQILDATLVRGYATIVIRFTADETCVIKDRNDNILAGNPDRVTEMVDVWVFARELRSSDPRWLVVETRDDVKEEHKTPLPEAS